ncbi:hypothetical protein FRC19_006230 [Serendipita sp. 401]|nr:hypothetical protein FRC19_006230 [Serendipita sp. 401]KAG9054503.1 hypothetical protein FS842_004960 [Serendipita sp. 407]
MTVSHTIIDLTVGDDHGGDTIDLTKSASATPNASRLQTPAIQGEEDSSTTSRSKEKHNVSRPKHLEHSEQIQKGESAQPSTSAPGRSTNNGRSTSTNAPVSLSKRKRRESLDSVARANNAPQGGSLPPSKRHRTNGATSDARNDEETDSNTTKSNKKRSRARHKPKNKDRGTGNASADQSEVEIPSKVTHQSSGKGSNDKGKQNKRSSQSPMPQPNGNKSKKKQKTTSRGRTKSKSSSPVPQDMFFVDIEPNKENKHLDEHTKPPYRLEFGNLQLPEHVLLETAEEAIMTPGNEIFPPESPGVSDEEIDVIDDRAHNIRRYWESQAGPALEECRTCGQFHESKLCVGTSVCFTCGSTSHQARRCPFKTTCYRCGNIGHIQAECPMRADDPSNFRSCDLCGSRGHGTHNCSRNWRVYKFNSPETREKDVQARLEIKPLSMEEGELADQENYVGLEPWCYACGSSGHLGDDCPTEINSSDNPSAFGHSNVMYGPFAPRYRRVADDIFKQFGNSKHIIFGDQVLDDSFLTGAAPSYEIEHPSSRMTFRPGESGKRKEQERMNRSKNTREEEEDDDWFQRRREQHVPRGPRVDREKKGSFSRRMSPPRDHRRDSRREDERGSGRFTVSLKSRLDDQSRRSTQDRSRRVDKELERRKDYTSERFNSGNRERDRDSRGDRERKRDRSGTQDRERSMSSRLDKDRRGDLREVIYSTGPSKRRRSRSPMDDHDPQ